MRRTASEVLNDLEQRIARLEGKTAGSRKVGVAYMYGSMGDVITLKAHSDSKLKVNGRKLYYTEIIQHPKFGPGLMLETPYGRRGVSDDVPYMITEAGLDYKWKNRRKGELYIF